MSIRNRLDWLHRYLKIAGSRLARILEKLSAPQWVSLALIVLTLFCAAILFWLLYQTSLEKDEQAWAKTFIFLIGGLTAAATVAVSWKPGKCSAFERLLSPFGAGLVMMAVFGAFGIMSTALSQFEPRTTTTKDLGKTNSLVIANGKKIDELNAFLKQRFPGDAPVLAGIKGKWGELDPACGVVWDITIRKVGDNAALIAKAIKMPSGIKLPPGEQPFRFVGDITSAIGGTLHVVGVEPNRGSSATFTLNGATQRLTWDDRVRESGGVEYRRCP